MTTVTQRDPIRLVLLVVVLGGLLALSVWVLRPFVPAMVWATMTVVATWPMMVAAQRRLRGKRWAAVTVMIAGLLLVFVVPLTLAIGTVVNHVDDITGWAKSVEAASQEPPPAWVAKIPYVGEQARAAWERMATDGELRDKLTPYMSGFAKWFVEQVGSFGAVLGTFLLTVAIAGVLYARGELAARGVLAFARRLGDEQGEGAVRLAGQAIRGVALGVVVTALTQSVLGGVGLAIAGVPLAALLTAIMFLLAVAQIGAVPVLACAVIWLYVRHENGWGTALLVWTVIVGSMDNVMRPILIKRGADLPLLLIFAGVVGGLMSFGLVGIFIGPMVLAVTWTLVKAWTSGKAEARIAEPRKAAPKKA